MLNVTVKCVKLCCVVLCFVLFVVDPPYGTLHTLIFVLLQLCMLRKMAASVCPTWSREEDFEHVQSFRHSHVLVICEFKVEVRVGTFEVYMLKSVGERMPFW